MIITGIAFVVFVFALVVYAKFGRKSKPQAMAVPTLQELRENLEYSVAFYRNLEEEEKKLFEKRVAKFLQRVRITGVNTRVSSLDKTLVAASAIIPIFNFPDWEYNNIDEVLLYPDTFNESYEQSGDSRNVLGMVGHGALNHHMILSQKALRQGFANANGSNVGIHEFVHLIDKADGATDGQPEYLLRHACSKTWMQLAKEKIAAIDSGDANDINDYGATNEAEFFAVISEYFFEKPEQLKAEHPRLYAQLEAMFAPS